MHRLELKIGLFLCSMVCFVCPISCGGKKTFYDVITDRPVTDSGSGGTQVTSPAKVWGVALQIQTDNTVDSTDPKIRLNINGEAMVVWKQRGGANQDILASRYVSNPGWETPVLIGSNALGSVSNPDVAINPSGNAVAVWTQNVGAIGNIWANYYTANVGWGTAQLIETDDSGSALSPQLGLDFNGNAIAVWYQSDGVSRNIWANRYTVGSGWGIAELIEANSQDAWIPDIAVDGLGNAIVVWTQSVTQGAPVSIWANRYDANSGLWETAQLVETDDTGLASGQKIASDPNGNAIVIWHQRDSSRQNIWANRYAMGVGWGTAELIETDDAGTAYVGGIAINETGNAFAVWQQSDGTRPNIWANRFTVGTGWGTAELVETDDTQYPEYPQIAIDPSGNALAVWDDLEGNPENIWANRYTLGIGWGTEQLIESGDRYAVEPQVGIDRNGNGIAVWYQADENNDTHIWASQFR